MTPMTSTKLTALSRKFCLTYWFRNLTKTGFSIFREGPNAFLATSILRIKLFLTGTTALISLPFLSFTFTFLFFSDDLILSCTSSTSTSLASLITNGFFSFWSWDDANTGFIGSLEMNTWITTIFIVEFFSFVFVWFLWIVKGRLIMWLLFLLRFNKGSLLFDLGLLGCWWHLDLRYIKLKQLFGMDWY